MHVLGFQWALMHGVYWLTSHLPQVDELTKDIKLYRTSQSKFQPLPFPEGMTVTSSDVITSLNDHLLHVLKELHVRESELVEAQEGLEKAQRKFSVIIHQQVCVCVCVCDCVTPSWILCSTGYPLQGVQ